MDKVHKKNTEHNKNWKTKDSESGEDEVSMGSMNVNHIDQQVLLESVGVSV